LVVSGQPGAPSNDTATGIAGELGRLACVPAVSPCA
jgi:hypothetical protein